jgi:6,7-dimethyl-8-ribityllumazine synthase
MHFEYLASAVSMGILHAAQASSIPMAFGVLTTLTDAQAAERSAPGPANKGREAALAAIEMVRLYRRLNGEAPA